MPIVRPKSCKPLSIRVSGLAKGPHTLAIEVTRTKNDAASDYYVIVDAFDVTVAGRRNARRHDSANRQLSRRPPAAPRSPPPSLTAMRPTTSASTGVQFFVDGTPVGAEDTTAPYEIAWNTSTRPTDRTP